MTSLSLRLDKHPKNSTMIPKMKTNGSAMEETMNKDSLVVAKVDKRTLAITKELKDGSALI